jgi:hypothetical protein
MSFGKGGSLCPSKPVEVSRHDGHCADFGRAGRLCFSDEAKAARPLSGQ